MTPIPEEIQKKIVDKLLNESTGSWKDLAEDALDAGYNLRENEIAELRKENERLKTQLQNLENWNKHPY